MSCPLGEPWGYSEFGVVRISKERAENAGSKERGEQWRETPVLKSHNATEEFALRVPWGWGGSPGNRSTEGPSSGGKAGRDSSGQGREDELV